MSATVLQAVTRPRPLPERDVQPGYAGIGRSGRLPVPPVDAGNAWLLDLNALVYCRELLAGHDPSALWRATEKRSIAQSLMDVPASYDLFCRSHFASVKRLHPELTWDDACPVYALALSAHAVLCEGLDEEREKQFELHWGRIRGQSNLSWSQARSLMADGCSALARLDPLAMRR